ncbi:MAG: hypothetical protein ACREMN_13570 [Gemmatimonadales bacterium]
MGARAVSQCVLIFGLTACDILPRPGDTAGDQEAGRWVWHGRLVVETDSRYTLVRLRIDTVGAAARPRDDVLLANFVFDPSDATGDEYALTVGLELGDTRRLEARRPYALGTEIPAHGTVTCLCRPLRPDSVRGSYTMQTRGSRQLAGRIDATLYFTAWNDSGVHATYRLRQRIHGIRP